MKLLFVVFAMSISPVVFMSAWAEDYTIIIPTGASDPSFDPQIKDRPEEWYVPTKLTIKANDKVTWVNNDTEKHTVTSGLSSGRTGFIRGDLGTHDGIFDSGLFQSEHRWSYTFTFVGTFPYFCTLHPWMFGVIEVIGSIPDYPQDAQGNTVELPVMSLTENPSYHVGTTWSPKAVQTGEQITFINDFFDSSGTKKEHLLKYEFVILQNGVEVHRSTGYSENGADVKYFAFSRPGPTVIRFEDVGGVDGNDVEFSTFVYRGPSEISANAIISNNKQDPAFINAGLYAAIFGPLGGGIALWMYYWRPWHRKNAKSV